MQIYLSSWSVRDLLQKGQLSYVRLPAFARDHGFSGVELFDRFFLSVDEGYLREVRGALTAARCGVVVAIGSDFTLAQTRQGWQRQLTQVQRFLKICRELGGMTARVCTGGQGMSVQKLLDWLGVHPLPGQSLHQGLLWQQRLAVRVFSSAAAVRVMSQLKPSPQHNSSKATQQKIERCIAALRDLRPVLEDLDMQIGVENHWGISTDPAMLVDIVRRCESERIGTCPDFGNFHPTQDRYEGLELLALFAKHVHAKSYAFDAAGNETRIDYPRCLRILRDADYDGPLSVEYEGEDDAEVAIQQTRDLILRHWRGA